MQANEFEKQVSNKMDELSFRPSAPVWANIEEQLRKKRERRRLLLWLPLFFLLIISSGVWLISREGSANDTIAENKREEIAGSTKKEDREKIASIEKQPEQTITNTTESIFPNQNTTPVFSTDKSTPGNSVQTNSKPTQKSFYPSSAPGKIKAGKENNLINNSQNQSESPTSLILDKATSQPVNEMALTDSTSFADSLRKDKRAEEKTSKDSTTLKDSLQKKDIKKKEDKKWTAGLIVFGGASGINSGSAVQQNAVILLPAANGPMLDLPVSKPQNKLALSLGFFASKKLGDRVSFITGLQYSLATNTIDIGSRQRRDTIISADYNAPVRVTQYYSKGLGEKDYINSYHFISLPIGIEMKLFSHTPIHLHAGFGFHQMIATNALVYSNQNQVYYHDKNAFHKTQFSTTFGLNYQASLYGRKLTVGPQVQYNWTQLQKDVSSGKHLFSAGLNARIDLIKL